MAHMLWPDRSAIGRRIGRPTNFVTVIGVVGDVRHGALESPFTGEVYYPLHQEVGSRVDLIVRTTLPLAELSQTARAALAPVAHEAAKNAWTPVQDVIDHVASPRRFVVVLLGGFASFALLLAALGIYALISYGVTQRRQEIGIRIALGATTNKVRESILRGTIALAFGGTLLGIVVAMLVVPAMNGLLFGVTWTDPASFVGAIGLLVVVAAVAGLIPAQRAARVDPSVVLRDG
jgi:predicted lysophospholipase L1 biosynthesis ABC-type transport system permease subunit